jgi:hypothetical protein
MNEKNAVNLEDSSMGNFRYQRGGNVNPSLHVTKNRMDVELF